MTYVPLREAVKKLVLHPNTLRKYADNGKIESIKNKRDKDFLTLNPTFASQT
ncbi:hypothetical protein [Anabaenopsis elenkinii]|uniref:hypothetical protein n=1 Tax=Anabaenopsis elenkinii TaxID=156213 RepID=UPI001CEDB640|nr:hypothetical protein [Anabaenopsis elenkinii]